MAVIHNVELGVEVDVPDATVDIWTVPVKKGGPGWKKGPAPWPRDDYGVAHKPLPDYDELDDLPDDEDPKPARATTQKDK